MTTAIPGRETPSTGPNLSWQAAAKAPVLPAEMSASTSPWAPATAMRTIEESRFWRSASTGVSCMPIVSAQ
jgi:hypothetical protein